MSMFDDSHDTHAVTVSIAGSMEDLQFAMSDDGSSNDSLAESTGSIASHDPQSDVHRLREKLAKAIAKLEKKDESLVMLEADRDASTKENNHLTGKINELEGELEEQVNGSSSDILASSMRSNHSFQDLVERPRRELREEKEKNEEKDRSITRLNLQIEETEENFAKETERMNGEIKDLEQRLKMEKEKARDLRDENKDLRNKNSDLEEDIHAAGLQREKDMADKENLRAQLKSSNKELKDIRKHKVDLEQEMHTTIAGFQQREAEAKRSEDDYKKRLKSSQEKLEEMASQFKLKNDRQEKQLPESPMQVQQSPEAEETEIDSEFDGDSDSRPPSRNDDLSQSRTLDEEIGELTSETEDYDHIQDQGDSDLEMDTHSDGADDTNSMTDQSFPSDVGLRLFESNLSTDSLAHDDKEDGWTVTSNDDGDGLVELDPRVNISLENGKSAIDELVDEAASDGNKLESHVAHDEDAKSIHTSACLADSGYPDPEHEESIPVDHARQPFGILTTSKQVWADERPATHTAQYAVPPFGQCACQKLETLEQGTQTENSPEIPEQGYHEEDPQERLIIGTLRPQIYLLYLLTILLGNMIGRLIRLEAGLRDQEAHSSNQIHDGATAHYPPEPMTTSVRKAEGHLKHILRHVLWWTCVLGVFIVRLMYVWWSDDEWQWATANTAPRCVSIELLTGHRSEHDWVQVLNCQVVKISKADRVALG